jgi:hypothetical protein
MTKQEKLSKINNELTVAIAKEKAIRAKAETDYYTNVHHLQKEAQEMRESVYSDPDEPQDGDQPTQWLNGEQWSCAVVARRILNKLPKLNSPKESFYIEISPSYFGGCGLSFRYINTINKESGVTSCELIAAKDTPDEQFRKAELWLKEVEVEMAKAQEIMREEADNE